MVHEKSLCDIDTESCASDLAITAVLDVSHCIRREFIPAKYPTQDDSHENKTDTFWSNSKNPRQEGHIFSPLFLATRFEAKIGMTIGRKRRPSIWQHICIQRDVHTGPKSETPQSKIRIQSW